MRSAGVQLNARRHLAEFVGTAFLVVAVLGSGMMATNLTQDIGVQLLANAVATGAALFALITIFAPISGASFNPVVTLLVSVLDRGVSVSRIILDIVAQLLGAFSGALVANAMFAHSVFETSTKTRSGGPQWFSEVIATVGLLLVIEGGRRSHSNVAAMVAAWITGAYWFTSSTSVANPAVGFGRIFSDSFAGIAPGSWPMFAMMELLGGVVALALIAALWQQSDVTA